MTRSFSRFFIIWMFIGVPWHAFASESFVIEGSLGQAATNTYSLADDQVYPSGKITSLRFHVPLVQNKYKILSATISNQMFDGKCDGPLTDQVQLLYYTSLGVGLSYRYYYLIAGAEYQMASFRQSTVGSLTATTNYTAYLPQVYAGFLKRLGSLGVGLLYSYKTVNLTPNQTGLPGTRTYSEQAGFLTLTFHFDGTRKNFLRGLFNNQPAYP